MTHPRLYKFFLYLGLVGLVEIASKHFNIIEGTNIGIISLITAYTFAWILGTDIAGIIAAAVSTLLGLSLLYLVVAFVLREKYRKE